MDETYLLNKPDVPVYSLKNPLENWFDNSYIGLDGRSYRTPEALDEANRKYKNKNLRVKKFVTDPNGVIRIEEVPIHSADHLRNVDSGLEEAIRKFSKALRSGGL